MEKLRRDPDSRIAVGNVPGNNALEGWLRKRFQADI